MMTPIDVVMFKCR